VNNENKEGNGHRGREEKKARVEAKEKAQKVLNSISIELIANLYNHRLNKYLFLVLFI